MKATATAAPAAAETKLWKVRAAIWLRWLMTPSPYACQLVLVRKLTAVLKDSFGSIPLTLSGLRSKWPCRRSWE